MDNNDLKDIEFDLRESILHDERFHSLTIREAILRILAGDFDEGPRSSPWYTRLEISNMLGMKHEKKTIDSIFEDLHTTSKPSELIDEKPEQNGKEYHK